MEIDDDADADAIVLRAPPASRRCDVGAGGDDAFDAATSLRLAVAPSLASPIVALATVAATATLAPADSIVRACVVSCGTVAGYAYSVLLLASVLHLLRAACGVCAMMMAWLPMPTEGGKRWWGMVGRRRGIHYGPVPSRSPEEEDVVDDGWSGGDGAEGEGAGVERGDTAVHSVTVIEAVADDEHVDISKTSGLHHRESAAATPSTVIRAGHLNMTTSDGEGNGAVGGGGFSGDDLGKDRHDTARTSLSTLLRFDCAVIAILYLSLCCFARFAWSPPTFDLDGNGNDVDGLTAASFPPEFLFGAATSSYQVEGNLFNNQWAEYEKIDGHIVGNQHCGAAADVWDHYFDQDLQQRIVSDLNLTAFRFSIEWSRVEPERGEFDDEALDKYASWASALVEAGVEPIVTLHHFTNPLWFERLGGFENETSNELILPYVRRVVTRLGAVGVKRWITINEIMVYAGNGYLMGEFPPGRKGEMGAMLRVVKNMLRAHSSMYRTIHEVLRGEGAAAVSVAKSAILYEPWSYIDPFAVAVAAASDLYYNAAPVRIMQQRRDTLDWLGLNSYIRLVVGFMGTSMGFTYPPERRSDMGWDLDPQVLYRAVRRYHDLAPALDIVVTEHGAADGDDPDVRRVSFLRESLFGLAQAVNVDGLPVVGYMHWSLLDNWEWSEGYGPKFGLYWIDLPAHQERRLTDGGKLYRDVISTRRVPGGGWRPK